MKVYFIIIRAKVEYRVQINGSIISNFSPYTNYITLMIPFKTGIVLIKVTLCDHYYNLLCVFNGKLHLKVTYIYDSKKHIERTYY